MSVRNKNRLLKDGEIVYESINDPQFALFMMKQLLPQHEWTVAPIYSDLEAELDALVAEGDRIVSRIEKIQWEINRRSRMPLPPPQLDGGQE